VSNGLGWVQLIANAGWDGYVASTSTAGTPQATTTASTMYELNLEALAQVKEMIYRTAVMRLVSLGPDNGGERPRQLNMHISSDP